MGTLLQEETLVVELGKSHSGVARAAHELWSRFMMKRV